MNSISNKMSITGAGTPCLIDSEHIDYAPWNPRPEITEADVAELAESIRDQGLLNRLSVMANPMKEGYFIVFAGNRRYAACRLAGIRDIPCEIFDVTTEEAKVLTALENLQRKDVEPLREAALVKECLDGGMNGEEIAAKVGKSSAWVTRRRKLLELDDSMREIAEKHPDSITTDALEHIAAYPRNIQKAVVGDISAHISSGSMVTWGSIGHKFRAKTQTLDDAAFIRKGDCADCAGCANRTGACQDLFGDVAEGKLGDCLNAKCFKRHVAEWEKKAIAASVPEGAEVVQLKYCYQFPDHAREKKMTKKTPCAYVYIDWKGDVDVRWGKSKRAEEAERKRQEEDEKAGNESRAASAKLFKKLNDIRESICDVIRDDADETALGREFAESASQDSEVMAAIGSCVKAFFDGAWRFDSGEIDGIIHALPKATIDRLGLADEIVDKAEAEMAIKDMGK